MIGRRAFLAGTSAALLASSAARAQAQMPLIALFGGGTAIETTPGSFGLFAQRLAALGYVADRDVRIVRFPSQGAAPDQLAVLAREIVALRPAVVMSNSNSTTLAMMQLTRTIPIVFAVATDPIGNGLVNDFVRPGGNVTGVIGFGGEAGWAEVGKLFEVLTEAVPHAATVGFLIEPGAAPPMREPRIAAAQVAGQALGVNVVVADLATPPDDVEAGFRTLAGRVDAAVFMGNLAGPVVAALAEPARLPVAYLRLNMIEMGGLMAYGTDNRDQYPMAADQVARILQGAQPADLPVMTNDLFRLGLNLRVARAIGLQFPLAVLARADVVIE